MAELADARDSKSRGLRPVRVRPPLPAPGSTCENERGADLRRKAVYGLLPLLLPLAASAACIASATCSPIDGSMCEYTSIVNAVDA
jgi:hypothetical protein